RDKAIAETGGRGLRESDRADLWSASQTAVAEVRAAEARRARAEHPVAVLAVAGAVGADSRLRTALAEAAAAAGVRFLAPPLRFCTDNAAMIAWAGIERWHLGARDGMDLVARPRWPLDEAAAPMLGAGKRGAKA